MPITVTPAIPAGQTSLPINVGQQVAFSATGGTAPYTWSATFGIINAATGLYTAYQVGTGSVTVVDSAGTPLTTTVPISVGSTTQFCVEAEVVPTITVDTIPCCEFNVESDERIQLRVPSLHMRVNDEKIPITWHDGSAVTYGDFSAITATGVNAYAYGNEVEFANQTVMIEAVTNFDMAQTGNTTFSLGFIDNGSEYNAVWNTTSGNRTVEIQNNGVYETGSRFGVNQGDVISFGKNDSTNAVKLYINNNLVFTSVSKLDGNGTAKTVARIAQVAKSIGGYLTNLTWTITTAGASSVVGTIDANGVYTAPLNPNTSVVAVTGTINESVFYVSIRNVKPSVRYTHPQPFLAGRKADIWVDLYKPGMNDLPILAADGSPDALSGQWIDLGTLEASATFAEDNQTQDFTDDEGIFFSATSQEQATLSGTFRQVRDLNKLARLMQHATLQPTNKGIRALTVGGKTCGKCELRVLVIAQAANCEDGYDVIYIPRAQNNGNLSFEIGKSATTGYPFNFRVLPDKTLRAGRQLYSIYQIENCTVDPVTQCN